MITAAQPPYLTPDDYLQLETRSPVKHEYINGEIVLMTGASDAHVTIAGNIFSLLRAHLRGTGCRVYISDMKVCLDACNCFYYPDVFVTCDPRDQETSIYKRFPCLIVEVLSDSTEAFDRGDKFMHYQTLASLQEYVLLNTRQQRVETFRRNSSGLWILQFYTADQPALQLTSIGWSGNLADLYEEVTLETQSSPDQPTS
ncbi:Uma2 family endonuclease [Leptodesmis sp.]|uniref:Uma2 family endonuclease n=1 Tax=Leptodesmis sp. TaxID=3100501 RepID=UPI004053469F